MHTQLTVPVHNRDSNQQHGVGSHHSGPMNMVTLITCFIRYEIERLRASTRRLRTAQSGISGFARSVESGKALTSRNSSASCRPAASINARPFAAAAAAALPAAPAGL